MEVLKNAFLLLALIAAAVFVNIKVYEKTRNWIYGFIASIITFFILGALARGAVF